MNKDEIYRRPIRNIEDFTFDQSVSDVFDDMIDRSVPGYRTLIANLGPIAAHFLQPGTNCYDLGCSHGAAALSIFQSAPDDSIKIIAIDNAPVMIEKCNQNIKQHNASSIIQTRTENVEDVSIENASFVLMNLTLQFVPIEQRKQVLDKIYHGLNKGGACIVTEKIIMEDSKTDELFQTLHENFKSANNYSALEISQKRKSLENVLLRESASSHEERLMESGFTFVRCWFQCLNFKSFLAIK